MPAVAIALDQLEVGFFQSLRVTKQLVVPVARTSEEQMASSQLSNRSLGLRFLLCKLSSKEGWPSGLSVNFNAEFPQYYWTWISIGRRHEVRQGQVDPEILLPPKCLREIGKSRLA